MKIAQIAPPFVSVPPGLRGHRAVVPNLTDELRRKATR